MGKANTDILFHRSWKKVFNAVARKTGYEGVGRLVMAIYDAVDREKFTHHFGEDPLSSGYFAGVFEVIFYEIIKDQNTYKRRIEEYAKKTKETNGGGSDGEED